MLSQRFSNWLQSEPEFDYVVDAANIAYTRQNHEKGKFSFRQVRGLCSIVLVTDNYVGWQYMHVYFRLK